MMNREDLIRARAHALWEAEGCPDGRDDQHWHQATLEIDEVEQQAEPASESPAPAAKRSRAKAAATPAKPRSRSKAKP